MKLFFDADVGTGVPKALREVDINCAYMVKRYKKRKSRPSYVGTHTPDEVWIPDAGRNNMLVISCNKAILETEAQRDLWIEYKVGGVFLTSGQEDKVKVLRLILQKLEWLELAHTTTERPFAYTMTIRGHAKQVLYS